MIAIYPGRYRRDMQVFLLLILFTPMLVWTSASAYDLNQDYGVDATIENDDNFRLSEDDPVSTVSSGIGVFADLQGTTEISSLRFAIGASGTQYSESSIEDSENYYLSLAAARSGQRWSGTLDLSFDLEPTTESELLDTGALVDGERRAVGAATGLSYQLDERNSIYANLGFSDVSYDTVSLTEYTDNSLSMGWVNQFSETSEVSLNASVSNYDPEDNDTTTVTSLNIGYGFSTSEATRYNLELGYAENDSPTGTNRDGDSSFEMRHTIDDRNGFSLFVGNGYVSSGAGEVRYESRLNLRWDHALAERMQFTLTSEGVKSDERDYIEIVAGGRHQYTREISFAANYRYRTQQSDTNDADSNSVLFSLSYSPI
jgi:hypothetical protein